MTSLRCPTDIPNGNGTHTARGGLIFTVCSRTKLSAIVLKPRSSKTRAITPTV
jgi:hypothetical protein